MLTITNPCERVELLNYFLNFFSSCSKFWSYYLYAARKLKYCTVEESTNKEHSCITENLKPEMRYSGVRHVKLTLMFM